MKNSHKLEEYERITIGLYQEKIAYWQNLMTQYVTETLKQKGLEPKDCSIDLPTGEIIINEVQKVEDSKE